VKIGPYEVESELGRGGMGVVYRARSPDGRTVAVKVVMTALAPNELARFEREARLLRLLGERDGIVPLLDSGTTETGPYLVMPFLEGGTLRQKLREGVLSLVGAVDLGIALGRALGAAHARGIIHRDVKPENVLFTGGGVPLLADLGLAKHFDRSEKGGSQSLSLSVAGSAMGTIGYMPVEQMKDAKNVGPPADVFALGAILYEALAGHPAFEGRSGLELLANIETCRPKPIRASRREVPPWLEAIVARALARDPDARFRDGAAVAHALALGRPSLRGGPRGRRGQRLALALAALVTVAAVVLAAVLVFRGKRPAAVPVSTPRPVAAPTPSARSIRHWKLPGTLGELELVQVHSGDFIMGLERFENLKNVQTIPADYWIGRTCVTWAQYLAFARTMNRYPPPRPSWESRIQRRLDKDPVVLVSLDDARAFATWSSLALPTQAEWERAARSTDGRDYPWGNTWDPKRANFCDASCPQGLTRGGGELLEHELEPYGGHDLSHTDGFPFTSPVGSFPEGASPDGVLDMAGNVFQWCDDGVSRGGSWASTASMCTCYYRHKTDPQLPSDDIGFRVVLRSAE
jgi:serine/threonine-protein kinase